MIAYDSDVILYNSEGKPYWEVDFLRFVVRTKDTDSNFIYDFSNLKRDETVSVIDPETLSPVSRTYFGGGHIVTLPPIKRSQALTIDEHMIEMSLVSANVQNMIYGYNTTRAVFQWHKGQLSVDTGKLIAEPVCELFGFVNGIDDKTQAPDQNMKMINTVTIGVVPRHAELEYPNEIYRSYEEGLKRSGDEIFLYVDEVGDWNIIWGKDKHKAGDGGKKKEKPKDKGPTKGPSGLSSQGGRS